MTQWGWLPQMGAAVRQSSTPSTAAIGLEYLGRLLRFAVFPVVLALAGCGGGGPPLTFDLDAAHEFSGVQTNRGSLAIYEPVAALPVASQRIVIRTGPEMVAYLKGAQWADRLPALVQTRLIESFENAHSLHAVGGIGLVASYSLQSEIRRFEADVSRGLASVEISVRIVGSNGAILASKVFAAEEPAVKDDAATVTSALDQALADVLRQIVLWATPKVSKA
jgi:cholesterol transport system auxiliary component